MTKILPTPLVFISGYANTGKKLFCYFYKITSFKNYNAGKGKKKFLLMKTYLPTTLIWHFSTDQSKLQSVRFELHLKIW